MPRIAFRTTGQPSSRAGVSSRSAASRARRKPSSKRPSATRPRWSSGSPGATCRPARSTSRPRSGSPTATACRCSSTRRPSSASLEPARVHARPRGGCRRVQRRQGAARAAGQRPAAWQRGLHRGRSGQRLTVRAARPADEGRQGGDRRAGAGGRAVRGRRSRRPGAGLGRRGRDVGAGPRRRARPPSRTARNERGGPARGAAPRRGRRTDRRSLGGSAPWTPVEWRPADPGPARRPRCVLPDARHALRVRGADRQRSRPRRASRRVRARRLPAQSSTWSDPVSPRSASASRRRAPRP